MTSNKIELNTDFDALLLSAQAKHKAYLDEVNKYQPSYDVEKLAYPSCIKNKIETAYEEWNSWVKKNITDKGLRLECDNLGRPTEIVAILASRNASYI